jgi:hypothetical protein
MIPRFLALLSVLVTNKTSRNEKNNGSINPSHQRNNNESEPKSKMLINLQRNNRMNKSNDQGKQQKYSRTKTKTKGSINVITYPTSAS